MRILILIAVAMSLALPAAAERFMGRKVEIVDGRTDPGRPAPLVVVLHGFLGTGPNMRKKTRYDLLARQAGFVAVFPNGRKRRWNDGRSPGNQVDDVAFLSALIGRLVADGQADPDRVFVAGHSNGGGMAMRMACDRPDLVRGIAVVATKIALNYPCRQGRPMPAMILHGTRDPISPHQGRAADSRLGGAMSSAKSLALWAGRNRCTGAGSVTRLDRHDDGTSAVVTDYAGCAAPLLSVVIEGHGHDWPGPNSKRTAVQGPATREVDATVLSWDFFRGL